MRHNVRFVVVALFAAVTVSACSRNQPPPETPPPPPPQPTQPTPPPPTPPPPPPQNTGPTAAEIRNTLQERVHFDYDRSDIRADAESVLQRKIPLLRENAAIAIRIEGHADERGSIEYNLALGQRRAEAVKAYLVRFGIAATRLTTESYGEERPIASGMTEAAYQQNRRAEFVITAGAMGNS